MPPGRHSCHPSLPLRTNFHRPTHPHLLHILPQIARRTRGAVRPTVHVSSLPSNATPFRIGKIFGQSGPYSPLLIRSRIRLTFHSRLLRIFFRIRIPILRQLTAPCFQHKSVGGYIVSGRLQCSSFSRRSGLPRFRTSAAYSGHATSQPATSRSVTIS